MKTVIEMAREAGAIPIHKDYKQQALVGNENIERFAELVRADERKECIHAAEVAAWLLNDPIAAIRARTSS